jgi:hypothetical protein
MKADWMQEAIWQAYICPEFERDKWFDLKQETPWVSPQEVSTDQSPMQRTSGGCSTECA